MTILHITYMQYTPEYGFLVQVNHMNMHELGLHYIIYCTAHDVRIHYDPKKCITAKQALEHAFFKVLSRTSGSSCCLY